MELSPHLMKLSLPCSRCKNVEQLHCVSVFHVRIECSKQGIIKGPIEEISKKCRGCPSYQEDMETLKSCLYP